MKLDTGENRYDFQRRQKATTHATLRAAAVAYLLYLAWTIVRDTIKGVSTSPGWLAWLTGIVFAAAAVAFGFYTWRRYRLKLQPAPPERKTEDSSGEETHEMTE